MGFGDRVSGSRGSAPAPSGGGGFGSRVSGRRHDGGKGRGGILGAISRLPGDVARDLYDVAVETPAGIAAIHRALADADPTNLQHIGHSDTTKLVDLGGAYKESVSEMIEHPLRHPGITALTVVPVVGQASRVLVGGTVASRAALAGEGLRASAAAGVRATVRPTVGERTLTIGGSTARGHYSRATVARGAQKVTDALLETELPGTVRLGQARYAKWNERTLRVLESKARSAGTRVAVLGKDLKPEEQLAFRMVAEEQPVRLRIAAQEMRAARATDPAEIGRHTERIGLQRAAAELLDESSGRPVLRDGRLQHIYDALDRASGERGGILDALGLLDEQAAQAAKVKTAGFAVGGTTEKIRGQRQLALVGTDGVRVSEDAPFIGNPVSRSRLTGRPKVSYRRTIGHTRKPGSLKTAAGGAIEHALERQDVTNIVAERHAEAVRLDDVRRRVDLVKDALQPVPSSDKDVWVWTDKTASTEALPQVVRDYLDNPEKLADLPDRAQHSVLQHLRDTVIKKDWNATPETHARFIELAKHGKGGFVPRRMLGNAGKPEPHLPFEPAIDAVNNAQKTALVYLKVSYPVIQTFSNAAMNLIQGAASPAHVARAVRLDRKLPPEYSAMIDDVMGEGAVVQAQFQGQGAIAHVTQNVARVMSSRVDRPFRKNAFYREAMRRGYETPERIMELFDDDANVNDFVEIAQRGKEAIVDFGEMSPTEQNVVRRILFVYPWQKGAVKYAGHFLRDHPVQAAALGYVGMQGAQIRDETLGPRPSYLAGVFDVGGDRLVNPAGLNFFQTPASIGQALTDPTSGKLQNFLAPAPGIAASFISGRDDIGRPLDKNPAKALYETQIQGIPAVDAAMSWAGHGRSSKSFPDPTDPRWRFFFGGMYPRPYDRGALNRNRALEKLRR